MNSAIELINHFIKVTENICQEIKVFGDFKYDHSISAAQEGATVGIYKIDELDEIHGFFTATAMIESDLISFIIDYGGIEYSLHAYIKIKGKMYSYSRYLQAVIGQTSFIIPNVLNTELIDLHADIFKNFLLESLPVFKSNPKSYTKQIAKLSKAKYAEEAEELTKLEAQAAIRRANVMMFDKNYKQAYRLYRKNKAYLSEQDKENMKVCRKFKNK